MRQSSLAPNMPLPGDDQAAVVYLALSELEGAADAAGGALRCARCPAWVHTSAGRAHLDVFIWCAGRACAQATLPALRGCACVGCTPPAVLCPVARRGATSGTESSSNGAGPGVRQAEPPTGPQGASGSGASSNGPGPEEKPLRVPHRWRVVGMMALAFVLCNMDKVLAPWSHACAEGRHASVLGNMDMQLAGQLDAPYGNGWHVRAVHVVAPPAFAKAS